MQEMTVEQTTEIRQPLTVEQLNEHIREYLAGDLLLTKVAVRGEISNMRTYPAKDMIFFTLKDEKSSLPATMFDVTRKLAFQPENGMKVLCVGRVSVYVRDGQYRFYAGSMEPDGVGSLAVAFEQLKKRLGAEGLFDPAHKKPLPKFPFRVGVITAENGAALQDIRNVVHRRFPAANLLLAPATVQGPSAPAELIRALRLLDGGKCDVIIIGRGGGSMEDLWCFNDEALAREIYACRTPVISAVGHEIDYTICDFVADQRAPTPSAAAELAVPDAREQLRKFGNLRAHMNNLVDARLQMLAHRLNAVASRPVLTSPQAYLDDKRMMVARAGERLDRAVDLALERRAQTLRVLSEKLGSLNPLAVLERGYAVVFDAAGGVVRRPEALASGERFSVKLAGGQMDATKV